MNDSITAGLAVIATLYAVNALAQETDNNTAATAQDSEIYLEEIRTACEAEAAGLLDAQDYIEQCVKDLTKSFTGTND